MTNNSSFNFSMLNDNICEVIFTKKNGEERTMLCTKSNSIIPSEILSSIKERGKEKKEGLHTVFDLEKNDWRAFNESQVISLKLKNDVTASV